MKRLLPLIISLPVMLAACKSSTSSSDGFDDAGTGGTNLIVYNNPPAEGFEIEGSSPVAILMADQVMNSMGGRAAWDNTNVIHWNFFGGRTLLWDKENNRVRIDMPSKELVMALNMEDMTGKVWKSGEEMTHADSLDQYLERAKRIWINDSYWLVMPFKLKDSGVTLSYVKEDTTLTGIKSDVLRMTFDGVGVTPQNAYEVWVDIDEKLIKQWAYYSNATQDEPNFVLPWTEYKQYGEIKLSGERGDRDLTEIKVLKKAPKGAFDSPDPLSLTD